MNLATALEILKNQTSSVDSQRTALEYLLDHRDELPRRLRFMMPGGHGKNPGPTWDRIVKETVKACGCGNPRAIVPSSARTNFEAGATLTINPDVVVNLRPIGGSDEDAHIRLILDLEEGGLLLQLYPFSGFAGAVQGVHIGQLPKHPDVLKVLPDGTPLLVITAVAPGAQSITVQLDKDVESFEPQSASISEEPAEPQA